MMFESLYNLGDIVFLITDSDQSRRIITGIDIRISGAVYELSCGQNTSTHFDFEFSKEKHLVV